MLIFDDYNLFSTSDVPISPHRFIRNMIQTPTSFSPCQVKLPKNTDPRWNRTVTQAFRQKNQQLIFFLSIYSTHFFK